MIKLIRIICLKLSKVNENTEYLNTFMTYDL